jgi:tetratricopeptide (TPR) repeat protein
MSPNDPTRVREEKARLYQSAVDAWGRGEVAAALQKLEELAAMDREFPDPDTGRGSIYRNFYNQVNSENDALKTAYESARAKVSSGDLDSALAICQQYLAKYPNHAPFQSLRAEIESRRHIPQAIAETDRKAEAEPDLERRVAILEEARRRYPGEAHFEAALQSACEMRDLVNSIVAQARFFEQNGQPKDALDQWQILKSIHPKQPGLAAQIERLASKDATPAAARPAPPAAPRAASQGQRAASQWIEQAQKYLDVGDYQRAMQAVSVGLAESPNDPELLALDSEVRKGQERATRALELLGRAHDEMNQGATESARNSLREAYQLDPRNAVIRTVLVNSLLEEARRALDSNVQSTEALVREVLRLEPGHPQAVILVQGIAERRAAPQPPVAPAFVPPPPPPAAPPIVAPLPRPIAVPPPPAAPPPVSLREAATVAVPPSVTEALLKKSTAKDTPASAPPAAVPPPKPVVPVPPKPGQPKKLLLGTAAAVVLLVAVALGVTFSRHRQESAKAPAASHYAVVLRSTPDGAELKIDGNSCGKGTCNMDLPPGNHQLSAELSGYQPATLPIVIGPGAAKEFNVTLTSQGPRVAIFTDMPDGAVSLDDAPAGQIQGGGAEITNLAAGKHVLAVKGADSTASIPVEISPGAAPALTGAIDAKNARCFVVAGFGGDAQVYASATGFRATLDGKPLGALAAAGLPLQGLTPGSHELVIDSDAGTHDRMVFESQPSASLYVSMGTSQTLGTLSVEITNEDQVHLLINGQRYKRDTTRGHLVVYLFPRKYTVTVQKDGFAPAVEQSVEVKKGADTKVTFTLSAAKAILAVHHAPPGTDVVVDNISRGTTHPDGEYTVGAIEPGHHTVILRHDGYRPMQTDQTFVAGKTLDLAAALEALPTTGTLRFEISPAGLDAHVRIKRDGDALEHEVASASATLPEGRYLVSVSAPQYAPASTTVQVTAGGTAVATVTLRHLETAKAPAKAPAGPVFGLEDWLKVPGWTNQNGLLTHRGGDWVMAPPDIAQGTIRFTVVSLKGRHVEWGVACRDEKNFVHYELDDKNLTRYEVRNGSKLTQVKVPHGLDRKKPMGISLVVTPQSVIVRVEHGGWVDLDKWDSVVAPVHGRFGFRIPGSDEIGLQDFTIQ